MIKRYWKIECSEHTKMLFEAKVNVNHISEKRLQEFIQTLMAKYVLTPEEILEEYLAIPFKKRKKYVYITRYSQTAARKNINRF